MLIPRLAGLCACLLATFLLQGAAKAQSFGTPVNLAGSFGTHTVAAGDFNNDGNPDLVSANNGPAGGSAGTVSVFLGAGDGTFGPKTDLPAVKNAQAVAVGDFDKDGKLDIAVANSNSDPSLTSVSIFLGNGDGTFKPRVEFPADSLANEMVTADFNKDGKLDLAVVTLSVVDILLGNGDGTFQPKTFHFVGSFSSSLVTGDFNGDGNADIATAGNPNSGAVDVLIGNGDGTFQNPTEFPSGPGPQGIAAGDLNGDGKIDLATANTHTNTVSVLLGNGNGTFQPKADFVAGQGPQSLKIADLDGDGKQDVVVASQSANLWVLRGNGDGTLRAAKNFDTGGGNPIYVTTGDVNHDNKTDLIGASFGGSVQVLVNRTGALKVSGRVADGAGVGLASTTMTLSGPAVASVSLPTNADGTYSFDNVPSGVSVTVTPAKHNYTFTPPASSFDALASDVTADFTGTLQLFNITGIVSGPGGSRLSGVTVTLSGDASATTTTAADGSFSFNSLPGSGNYTLTPTLARFTFFPSSVNINDLSSNRAVGFTGALRTFTISGRVTAGVIFPPAALTVTLSGSKTAKTETSFDGSYSFSGLTIGGDYTVTVSPRSSDTAFRNYVFLQPTSRTFLDLSSDAVADFGVTLLTASTGMAEGFGSGVAAGDFNGDGKIDFALSSKFVVGVNLLLGDGNGVLQPGKQVAQGEGSDTFTSGDFDGDGKLDIALANRDDQQKPIVTVLYGNGDGTFSQKTFALPVPNPFSSARGSTALVAVDLNGDGKLDLAEAGASTDINGTKFSVNVLRNGGGRDFTLLPATQLAASPKGGRAADFNGDGKADLVLTNDTSTLSVLLGNGDGSFAAPSDINLGGNPRWPVVGDFNNDGKADIVAHDVAGGKVHVLLGKGDGTFQPSSFNASGGEMVAADFNGDGKLDLSILSVGPKVETFFGNGDGTFGGAASNFFNQSLVALAAADFNGDGAADLAVVSQTSSGQIVNTLLNTSAATRVAFSAASYSVNEKDGGVLITVTRTGDLSRPASVKYATSDGTASERSDYTAAIGTLNFAPGESSKSFSVFVTDDALAEGSETVTLGLGDPAGALLGGNSTATLTIANDASVPASSNPIDGTQFFVRQHYVDFLNREPDAAGLAFWVNEIESCGTNAQCREVKRINVSAAFFKSIEFQQTGYFVYLLSQSAFNTGETLRLRSFLPDTQEIGRGVVVGSQGWEQQLEANKQAFVEAFVARPSFAAAYPASMTPAQFVDALNANTFDPANPAGGALSSAEREQLVGQLTAAGNTAQARAAVLRSIVENGEFSRRRSNRAFVLMQYFGYLRRNPNDLPNNDFSGYNFWLNKLEEFHGNFVAAEMVKAFLSSDEYRKRFGQ